MAFNYTFRYFDTNTQLLSYTVTTENSFPANLTGDADPLSIALVDGPVVQQDVIITGNAEFDGGTSFTGTVNFQSANVNLSLSELTDVNLNSSSVTKGDIFVFSGTDWQNLPVGDNNQILTASNTATLGVEWVSQNVIEALDVYGGSSSQTFSTSAITVILDNVRLSSSIFTLSGNVVTVSEDVKGTINYKVSTEISNNGIIDNRASYSVSKPGTGLYVITLDNPHPDGICYPVAATVKTNPNDDDYMINYTILSSTQFEILITEQDNGGTAGVPVDSDFAFSIPNNNNTYAWGVVQSGGLLECDGSTNASPVAISRAYLETSSDGIVWTLLEGSDLYIYNREETFGRGTASGSINLNIGQGTQFRLRVEKDQGDFSTLSTIVNGSSLSFSQVSSGARGPQGPVGSGSNINVKDNNILVTGSPFETLNFSGITVTQNSFNLSQVDIDVSSLQVDVVNGVRHYGTSPSDPTSPTPQDGDQYYNTVIHEEMRYDASRGKWLSVTTLMDGAGFNGSTTPGTFYRRWNGMDLSDTLGPPIPRCTIIRAAFSNSTSGNIIYEIRANGATVATVFSSSASSASNNALNVDVDPVSGEFSILSSRNGPASITTNLFQSVIYYKLRSPS